jgi:hypothetical protein
VPAAERVFEAEIVPVDVEDWRVVVREVFDQVDQPLPRGDWFEKLEGSLLLGLNLLFFWGEFTLGFIAKVYI